MIPHFCSKAVRILLLSVLLLGEVGPVAAAPAPSAARAISISDLIPGARLISGWLGRNRTYRSADQFETERNQYYDGLRDTLRKELQSRTILTLRKSQLAAYIKEVSLIEGERAAAINFAEGIKNGARRDFTQAVKQELLNRVMATGMMTQLFGAIKTGFSQAQIFLDGAIKQLESGGSIGDAIGRLNTVTLQLRVASGLFGGSFGAGVRDKLEQITGRITSQAAETKQDLIDVKAQLTDVQNRIAALQSQNRLPASSQVEQDLAMQLVGWGQGTPETEAILGLLGRRSGLSLDQVRTRGMALLEAGDLARCREKAAAVINELRRLQNKDTDSPDVLQDVKPEELCKEVRAQDLFPEVAMSTVAVPTPKATATVGWVDPRLKFLDSDCPSEGVSKVTPYPDWGSLSCNFAADNGKITESFAIREYQAFNMGDLQKEWSDAKGFWQTQQAGDLSKPNAHLTTAKDDATDYLFLITYDGDIPTGSKTAPLCAFGGGNQILDGKFYTGFNFRSCSLGSSGDYLSAFQALVDSATMALDQAESRAKP